MVEKFLLYPSFVSNLIKIRSKIFCKIGDLKVKASLSSEPVAYENINSLKFTPFSKGQIWGSDYDCAWFDFEGIVPSEAKGKHVVALVNIQGEGLVWIDGKPTQGITQVIDGIDIVQSAVGKQEVELFAKAQGGEKIHFLVDAGFNGKKKKQGAKVKLVRADIAICNDDIKGFYYDALQLFMLLITYGQNEYLTKERAQEIKKAMKSAFCAYNKGDLKEAVTILKSVAQKSVDYKAVNYTAIGHAHLDLAYLWPIRETKRKGARTFANQLANLKKYPDYVFGASQAQLFDWMKNLYPQIYSDIKQAVADNRIEIQGAMWTENDCNIPSGESIIRQFLHGEEFFQKEFGKTSRMVWLPDVFGYPASLPQIFRGCGKDYFATIKLTWNNHNKFPYKTFSWKGIDGTSILSHMAPQGNYNSTATPMAWVKSFKGNPQKESVGHALMIYGIGDGGGGPGEAPLEMLARECNQQGLVPIKQASAQSFFEQLESDKSAVIPEYEGELYLEKHQGTYTSQAKNKLYNRLMEQKLHNLEWLCSLAELKGISYDKDAINKIWKEVMLYQFHDIIPGSSIKRVFEESVARYEILHNQVVEMINNLLYKMRDVNGVKSVVNTVDFEREEYICDDGKWYFAKVAPYGVAEIAEADKKDCLSAGEDFIQNNKLKVQFCKEGWITSVVDLESGKELCKDCFNKLVVYEDPKLFYNAWDIREDYRKLPHSTLSVVSCESYTEDACAIRVTKYKYGNSSFVQKVSLKPDSKLVEFDTWADWHEDHKMLRAEFVPVSYSDKVNCDIQFGNVDRDTADDTPLRKAQFEICAHKFVNVDDKEDGFALLSNCKYGYRVKDGYISLNLLRSPKRPDPDCDRGNHYFGYAFYPHQGKWNECDLVKQAYCYNYPLIVSEFKPKIEKLIEDSSHNVIIETIKPAHDGKGIVARLYERYGEDSEITLKAGFRYKAVYEADMLERKGQKLSSANIKFTKYQIKTLYFEL